MISDQYAVGIFDGEGWVTSSAYWTRGKYENIPRVLLQIGVANNHRGVLDLLSEKYGGKVYGKSDSGKVLAWRVVGKEKMRFFLESVLPHLVVKKEEALLALQFIDTIREDNLGCVPLGDVVHELRHRVHIELRRHKPKVSGGRANTLSSKYAGLGGVTSPAPS